jgi:hypothetical protein
LYHVATQYEADEANESGFTVKQHSTESE